MSWRWEVDADFTPGKFYCWRYSYVPDMGTLFLEEVSEIVRCELSMGSRGLKCLPNLWNRHALGNRYSRMTAPVKRFSVLS